MKYSLKYNAYSTPLLLNNFNKFYYVKSNV
jgi:hypothetical protein